MPRLLILCTHNSARSQMAEGLARRAAQDIGLDLDVFSAGTQATAVKPDAVAVMAEIGLDLSANTSKTLFDVPDPWTFDYVVTVCDSAAEACPAYPATTVMRHYPFVDPSGGILERWRTVRDQLGVQFTSFARALAAGRAVPESYADAPPVDTHPVAAQPVGT
ncbi:arsenate reductase ArsC (plasmid) [Deinococcus radiomollis]|uniref:arsenate reductase ArsC n=1 Tax=Deinococcus radiomollis TaxID=468916 RepID=UPI0038924707